MILTLQKEMKFSKMLQSSSRIFFEKTIEMIDTVKNESLKKEMLSSLDMAEYYLRRIKNKSDFSEEEIYYYSKMLELYSHCSEIVESVIEKY